MGDRVLEAELLSRKAAAAARLCPRCGVSLKADDFGRLRQLVVIHDLNKIAHPAQR